MAKNKKYSNLKNLSLNEIKKVRLGKNYKNFSNNIKVEKHSELKEVSLNKQVDNILSKLEEKNIFDNKINNNVSDSNIEEIKIKAVDKLIKNKKYKKKQDVKKEVIKNNTQSQKVATNIEINKGLNKEKLLEEINNDFYHAIKKLEERIQSQTEKVNKKELEELSQTQTEEVNQEKLIEEDNNVTDVKEQLEELIQPQILEIDKEEVNQEKLIEENNDSFFDSIKQLEQMLQSKIETNLENTQVQEVDNQDKLSDNNNVADVKEEVEEIINPQVEEINNEEVHQQTEKTNIENTQVQEVDNQEKLIDSNNVADVKEEAEVKIKPQIEEINKEEVEVKIKPQVEEINNEEVHQQTEKTNIENTQVQEVDNQEKLIDNNNIADVKEEDINKHDVRKDRTFIFKNTLIFIKEKFKNINPFKNKKFNFSNVNHSKNLNKDKKLEQEKDLNIKPKIRYLKLKIFLSCIIFFMLVGTVFAYFTVKKLIQDMPEFDIKHISTFQSSKIYDQDNVLIAEVGKVIRDNITYSKLPQSVIDAFVAIEDSRFFEHDGFDIPRFAMAVVKNLQTRSMSQGGSTISMQLIKNTYFTNDETQTMASRSGVSGIKRKLQEIALAYQMEKQLSKQQILEAYLNVLNFGGQGNIRGISKACQYYFSKNIEDISITQAAMLAGIINAPSYLDPYNNLEACTERRNEVLNQMYNHGYISKNELAIAKSIKLEDELVYPVSSIKNGTGTIKNQAYIDEVILETIRETGLSPYTTSMKIYTYLNTEFQQIYDDITDGKNKQYNIPEFTDEYIELASITIDNKTGGIIAIMGGRNYSSGGQSLLNHATQQFNQPGSSIKPFLDYALAFETLGWSTSHVLCDKQITYPGTDIIINNASRSYYGEMTVKEAIARSLNTPAIQALDAVIQAKGNQYCVDYLNSLGITTSIKYFNVQYAIGGSSISVSCQNMAGALSMILNGGVYTQPHTISKIVFDDSTIETYIDSENIKPVEILSSAAAYQTADLMYYNVYGPYNLLASLRGEYPLYGKTGTTNWGKEGQRYNIPNLAAKDSWVVVGTNNISTATWYGYDSYSKDRQSYINTAATNANLNAKLAKLILTKSYETYPETTFVERPDTVRNITHIIGTFPYAIDNFGVDPSKLITGIISKDSKNIISPSYEYMIKNYSFDGSGLMDISNAHDGSIIGRRLFDFSQYGS